MWKLVLCLVVLTLPAWGQFTVIPDSGVVAKTCGGTDKFSAVDAQGNFTCSTDAGAAGGDSVTVNGAATTDVDLDDADPAAPANGVNVNWQLNTTPNPDSVSAYVSMAEFIDGTFGSGSGFTWTFDAGVTNVVLTFASDSLNIGTADLTLAGGQLIFSDATANTKIQMFTGYGIGVQGNDYRFHVDASGSNFNFLDAPAGNRVFQIRGAGGVQLFDRGARPACNAGNLFLVWAEDGSPDTAEICLDTGAGLAWTSITEQSGSGGIDCSSPSTLTIAAGAVTVSSSACYLVDTESAASSDDLDTINCSTVGTQFILRPADDTHTVVVKNNGTTLANGTDFSMDSVKDVFMGICTGVNEVTRGYRSNNGG
jgi:hypothetical protein